MYLFYSMHVELSNSKINFLVCVQFLKFPPAILICSWIIMLSIDSHSGPERKKSRSFPRKLHARKVHYIHVRHVRVYYIWIRIIISFSFGCIGEPINRKHRYTDKDKLLERKPSSRYPLIYIFFKSISFK